MLVTARPRLLDGVRPESPSLEEEWSALPASTAHVHSDASVLFLILKALKEGSLEDLRQIEIDIHNNNQKKKALRDIRSFVSGKVEEFTDDKGKYTKGNFSGAVVDGVTLSEAQLTAEYERLTGQPLNLGNKNVVQDIDNSISTLNDLGDEVSTKLQLIMQRYKENSELLSGTMKVFHEIASGIIGKIGQV